MTKTFANHFVETIVAVAVKRVYGVVDDSLNGLSDAFRRQGEVVCVHIWQEEVAALAAVAEAHPTGEFAVCLGNCRPSSLHLIDGLQAVMTGRVDERANLWR